MARALFRVFLSSTFGDFQAERERLRRDVWGRMETWCAARGASFQVVDLRWGITEDVALSHETIKVCLDEVKRCQLLSPRPSFVMLLGDRYGWRPAPTSGGVIGAQILHDGKILSWSTDRTLRLWDQDGKSLQEFKGHRGAVTGALIIPDGRMLSWSVDTTLRLWGKDGIPQRVLRGHLLKIGGVLVLPGGRFLSWESDDRCTPANFADLDEDIVTEHELHMQYTDIRGDHAPRIWSSEGELLAILYGHTKPISGVQILPNKQILSWSEDNTFRLWDSEGNTLDVLRGHERSVYGVLVLLNGQILSWGNEGTLRLWSNNGEPLKELKGHTSSIYDVLQFPDGEILTWSIDGSLRLWAQNGEPLAVMNGHKDGVLGAQILSGSRILSWGYDDMRLWSKDGKALSVLAELSFSSSEIGITILSDGRIISWSGSHDNTIRQWDSSGKPLNDMIGHTGTIVGVNQLWDRSLLSWSNDSTLRLWDTECIETIPVTTGII